jgi:hypothetical protein
MSSSLACRQCGQPIKFDDKHVSQRTGKKIPLDVETNEPHDCPARKDQQGGMVSVPEQQQQIQEQRRYHQCNKGCGQEIYFDASNKSQSGKYIPLERHRNAASMSIESNYRCKKALSQLRFILFKFQDQVYCFTQFV